MEKRSFLLKTSVEAVTKYIFFLKDAEMDVSFFFKAAFEISTTALNIEHSTFPS